MEGDLEGDDPPGKGDLLKRWEVIAVDSSIPEYRPGRGSESPFCPTPHSWGWAN